MKSSEIFDWLENTTNPTHKLITEINNVIYKDGIISVDKSDIENALKNSIECDYHTVRKYNDDKEISAIKELCESFDLKNAKYFIVIISQNGSLTFAKTHEMLDLISEYIDSDTQIIIGDYEESRIWNDIKITGMALK